MKKLNYNEFAEGVNYKKPHTMMKLFCSFTKEESSYSDLYEARIKPFWFAVFFIPMCVYEFFGRILTEIIMDFEIPQRLIAHYRMPHKYTGG